MSNDSDADLLWLLRLMRQHPHDAEVFAAIDNHLSTNNWECPVPLGELFSQSSTSSSSSSLTGLAKTVADRLLLHQQPAVVEWLLTKRYFNSNRNNI
jgi:hypothetical protein